MVTWIYVYCMVFFRLSSFETIFRESYILPTTALTNTDYYQSVECVPCSACGLRTVGRYRVRECSRVRPLILISLPTRDKSYANPSCTSDRSCGVRLHKTSLILLDGSSDEIVIQINRYQSQSRHAVPMSSWCARRTSVSTTQAGAHYNRHAGPRSSACTTPAPAGGTAHIGSGRAIHNSRQHRAMHVVSMYSPAPSSPDCRASSTPHTLCVYSPIRCSPCRGGRGGPCSHSGHLRSSRAQSALGGQLLRVA